MANSEKKKYPKSAVFCRECCEIVFKCIIGLACFATLGNPTHATTYLSAGPCRLSKVPKELPDTSKTQTRQCRASLSSIASCEYETRCTSHTRVLLFSCKSSPPSSPLLIQPGTPYHELQIDLSDSFLNQLANEVDIAPAASKSRQSLSWSDRRRLFFILGGLLGGKSNNLCHASRLYLAHIS